jgi:hypothetical protein
MPETNERHCYGAVGPPASALAFEEIYRAAVVRPTRLCGLLLMRALQLNSWPVGTLVQKPVARQALDRLEGLQRGEGDEDAVLDRSVGPGSAPGPRVPEQRVI